MIIKKSPNLMFFFNVILLILIGFLMVFSATTVESLRSGDPLYYFKRQMAFIAIGFVAMLIGYLIDYNVYKKYAFHILVSAFLILLIVFIPGIGKNVGGAYRWIDLGFFSFQPSEITKILMIFYLSSALTNKGDKIKNFFKGVFPILLIIVLLSLLLLKQPDLGTALVIFLNALIMIFLAGAKWQHLFTIFPFIFISVLYLSYIAPYRWKRIIAFLNPWKDPLGIGFHTIQSLIAIGSGGFFGFGPGGSRQKFLYLPEQYTDFIFAIVCEEFGFFGATLLILLIVVLVLQAINISQKAPDMYSRLLCLGFASYIGLQSFINMGVATGIMPTTGIPLPFISYGGTSLIATMYFAGVILNISRFTLIEQKNEK